MPLFGARRSLLRSTALTPVFSVDFTGGVLPSSVTVSRASNATIYDSTGKLTYAPNNLLTYSNDFTNAAWAKTSSTISAGVSDPFGGTTAATFTVSANLGRIDAGAGAGFVGRNSITTIWMRRRTGTGAVYLYDVNGFGQTQTVTSSWQLFYVVSTATTAGTSIRIALGTSGDAIDICRASFSAVTYETSPRAGDQVVTTSSPYFGPRFDYDPSTLKAKGLLIEEPRTNLGLYSQTFNGAAWIKGVQGTGTTPVVTDNAALAPDGTTSAARVQLSRTSTTAGDRSYMRQAPTATSSTAHTASIWLKSNTGSNQSIALAVSGSSLVSAAIVVTSQWQRFTIAYTTGSSETTIPVWIGLIDSLQGVTALSADLLYWGFQLEAGAFATSYIPTGASAVSRSADVVQMAGNGLSALQGVQGTLFIETTDIASASAYILSPNGTRATPYIGSSKIAFFNGTVDTFGVGSTLNLSSGVRAGIGWSPASVSITANGNAVVPVSTTGGLSSTTITSVYVGQAASGYFISGHLAKLAIYNQRLPDALLKTKSVVGAAL